MRYILFFVLFFSHFTLAQHTIRVYNSQNHQPIQGAKIICDNTVLGTTNTEGKLIFRTHCNKVEVQAKGFLTDEVMVDTVMEVALDKGEDKTHDIEAVALSNSSDPRALAILEKVNHYYKKNAPTSLDSYSYKSYEKISLDMDQDSIMAYVGFINKRKDSLTGLSNRNFFQKEKIKKDSLERENFMSLITQSSLFLWERASEYLYSQKYGEKVNILDNRMSGFQNPIYELMTVRSNRNSIPREISPENQKRYRYYLTDTIDVEGRSNYVIRFRQVDFQPNRRRKFSGYIYIDTETFGIKKIESISNKTNEGSITSVWIAIDGKWFINKEKMKLRVGSMAFNPIEKKDNETEAEREKRLAAQKKFGNYVFMKADFFDYKTSVELKDSQFKGYTMSVLSKDGSKMEQYRTDSLSQREKLTYGKIDSLGAHHNVDRYVEMFRGVMRGKITVGKIDIDPSHINVNRYEGFRLGVGFKTNHKFSRRISPDVYMAYGFEDKVLKYGLGLDVYTSNETFSFFRIEYFDDVAPAGRFNQNLWTFSMRFMNAGMNLKNDKYYLLKGFRLSYQTDLSNELTVNVSIKKQQQSSGFEYQYLDQPTQTNQVSSLLSLKYSPNSKNIMTPNGHYTYTQGYPEFYINYEQGFKAFGGANLYSRVDALAVHQFKSRWGITGIQLYGGFFTGNAPIWNRFEMGGVGPDVKNNLLAHVSIATYIGFATMNAGRYYNDRFVGYSISQGLPWVFKSFDNNTSSLNIIYKGGIGDMSHPEEHRFDFKVLNKLYQEVGLEYVNFLSRHFNLLLFYRVGPYMTNDFKSNFAVQLKLKLFGL